MQSHRKIKNDCLGFVFGFFFFPELILLSAHYLCDMGVGEIFLLREGRLCNFSVHGERGVM